MLSENYVKVVSMSCIIHIYIFFNYCCLCIINYCIVNVNTCNICLTPELWEQIFVGSRIVRKSLEILITFRMASDTHTGVSFSFFHSGVMTISCKLYYFIIVELYVLCL